MCWNVLGEKHVTDLVVAPWIYQEYYMFLRTGKNYTWSIVILEWLFCDKGNLNLTFYFPYLILLSHLSILLI